MVLVLFWHWFEKLFGVEFTLWLVAIHLLRCIFPHFHGTSKLHMLSSPILILTGFGGTAVLLGGAWDALDRGVEGLGWDCFVLFHLLFLFCFVDQIVVGNDGEVVGALFGRRVTKRPLLPHLILRQSRPNKLLLQQFRLLSHFFAELNSRAIVHRRSVLRVTGWEFPFSRDYLFDVQGTFFPRKIYIKVRMDLWILTLELVLG